MGTIATMVVPVFAVTMMVVAQVSTTAAAGIKGNTAGKRDCARLCAVP